MVAKYNDNDELAADFNIVCFTLANYPLIPPQNIDTEMMKQHPDIYGGDPGYHPYILGIWATWCNLEGGEYTPEAKQFFSDISTLQSSIFRKIEGKIIEFLIILMNLINTQQIPYLTPDTPKAMSRLTKMYSFPERVHANPYVMSTWCGQSQEISTNGFCEWARDITYEGYQQSGCYCDFEWVVCGGKYSKNVTNLKNNPCSIPWRDTTILCFQYLHYDNTKNGQPWKEPEEFSRKWVEQQKSKAIGTKGYIGKKDRRWNAFPGTNDFNLDELREFYFESDESYQRVLMVKQRVDPDHIFTPNLFCVGASLRNDN